MRAQASLAEKDIFILAVLALSLCGNDASGQKMPASTQGPSVAPTVILGNASDYAGIARCRSCHKPEYREYEKTAHAKVSVPGKDYVSGCEVCHGPGKAHADAIEAAEGDEGKEKRALEEHPIFSFAVNAKITTTCSNLRFFISARIPRKTRRAVCCAT